MIKYLNGLGTTKVLCIQLLFLIMFCTSCVPVLIGSVAYHAVKSKKEKREFMDNYNKTNIEREKVGLPPLDLCTEKYHFDEGYAKDDPPCKKRVEAYEAGDTTALGHPELTPTSSGEGGKNK